ncbi:MAG: hypothetical protein H6818_07360 [Phycisphaerales bacterium]|nr:hypothetical protein [Phycisphaerales bacterium]
MNSQKTHRESLDADRGHVGGPQEAVERRCVSARERLANRDWLPGLHTSDPEAPAVTTPGLFADTIGEPRESGRGGLQTIATLSTRSEGVERFAVANREWYPGLCMTCVKLASCSFPKPEGGVFSCDEFE